jgi:hypothetical protein
MKDIRIDSPLSGSLEDKVRIATKDDLETTLKLIEEEIAFCYKTQNEYALQHVFETRLETLLKEKQVVEDALKHFLKKHPM